MKLANTGSNINTTAPKTTICVHGNIVQEEYPKHIDEVSRKGWGATFWGKENTVNWFHIPLSVPNILDGGRPKLTKTFFYFQNTSRSPVTAVHIYDGPKIIRAYDNLRLVGDHTRALSRANSFQVDPAIEVAFGLGLSVRVDFLASAEQAAPRWVLFTTAGAEFRS